MSLLLCALPGSGQNFTEWKDPAVNSINRAPMHASFFAYESKEKASAAVREESDRKPKPNPHLDEVRMIHQSIRTTPENIREGKIRIFNENFFYRPERCNAGMANTGRGQNN